MCISISLSQYYVAAVGYFRRGADEKKRKKEKKKKTTLIKLRPSPRGSEGHGGDLPVRSRLRPAGLVRRHPYRTRTEYGPDGWLRSRRARRSRVRVYNVAAAGRRSEAAAYFRDGSESRLWNVNCYVFGLFLSARLTRAEIFKLIKLVCECNG